MTQGEPPGGDTLLESDTEAPEADLPEATEAAPAVLAVVVTRNPGPWLEEALQSLSDQDYPRLTTLVVDVGSGEDPSARIDRALPGAFVRRVAEGAGFAAAANHALAALEDVPFLLVCHDDIVLEPNALRLLIEEAYRSNAGIVGPKLVQADNPEVLLEVGRAIDRYGAPHTGIEPGELDQEQHDGVRDVFYVSSAAMLVRSDLFRELGGFDPATFPGAEDLDLCWRARLAGARVLVAPDARVRHREAAEQRGKVDVPETREISRSRVRALLTSYSFWSLLWVVPVGIVLAFGEAILSLITRRRGRARAALGAWWWNLRHLGDVRRSRGRAQKLRRIHDGELRELQVRGSAQLRDYLSHHLHTEERLQSLTEAGRSAVDAASTGARQPVAVACLVVAVLFLAGSRDLILGRVPAVGTFAAWPGVFDLLEAYSSGWRFTGLGSPAAAPPAFAFMAALGAPLLGAMGLARTLVVVGAFPIGAIGVYRLARPLVGSAGPAGVAALVYVINPVPRNAVAAGRLGPLVVYALGPFLVAMLVRGAAASRTVRSSRARLYLGLAVVTAIATAFFPLAPLWLLAVALAVLLASPAVGGSALGLRMLGLALVAIGGALVLLVPWPLEFLGADGAAVGFAFRPSLSLADVLRFESGPSGAAWAAFGFLAAAALSLAIATGPRLAWAARAWALALVGFAAVWVPARFSPDTSVPAPEAGLSVAALGLALAAGLGVAALVEGELRRYRFGWRQPVVALAGLGLALSVVGFAADAADGRWHAPGRDWNQTLGFLRAEQVDGGFRVLWVGDPTVLPLDPAVTGEGVGYVLTRNGPGNGRELFRAPERRGDRLVGDALDLVTADRTNRLGHLLAPMAVRYVAIPQRAGPRADVAARAPAAVTAAIDAQTDLVRLGTETGLVLYENAAWAATRATLDEDAAADLPLDSEDPLRVALRTELDDAESVKGDSSPAGPGTLLWSEAYDDDWTARGTGRELDHVEPFGLTNGYELPDRASVSITYGGQLRRYLALTLQALVWAGVAVLWWRTRPRAEREVRA
ncbi:MAG: glycosyltransferase [Actinomycetota bacterium]